MVEIPTVEQNEQKRMKRNGTVPEERKRRNIISPRTSTDNEDFQSRVWTDPKLKVSQRRMPKLHASLSERYLP